jgi:hypothetical protein
MVLLLCTACSQDVIDNSPTGTSGNYIAFNPLTERSTTRAEVTDNTNFNNFAVWAGTDFATPPLVLTNEFVYKVGNTWTYEPAALWSGNTMDFFAYSPALSSYVTDVNATIGAFKYTVPEENAPGRIMQEDLLVAYRNDVPSSGGDVALQFQHALSRAVFRAKSGVPGINLIIKRVTLNNLYSKGTLTLTTAGIPETGGFTYQDDHSSPVTLWTDLDARKDYDVAITKDVTAHTDNTAILVTNTMTQLHRDADAAMIMPQATSLATITDNVVANEANVFYLTVAWTLSTTPNASSTITNFPVVFPDTSEPIIFEAGRQYTFDITMTEANGIKLLTLNPSVSDWKQYEDNTGPIEPISVPYAVGDIYGDPQNGLLVYETNDDITTGQGTAVTKLATNLGVILTAKNKASVEKLMALATTKGFLYVFNVK